MKWWKPSRESFSKAQLIYWSLLCLECRLKPSVGSLVTLLFSLWHTLAFLSSPKSGSKFYFFKKKPPKNREQNQTNQAWCPGADCMHYHGCSFSCGANVGSVRTHQCSDATREAEESRVILFLAQYEHYINTVFICSFIHTSQQCCPFKGCWAELRLLHSWISAALCRQGVSALALCLSCFAVWLYMSH